ncbi:response regulator transcription factor [Hydrogenophaga palleronii]|uniref:response regulator transcription factor n=1 Tax=Hydrogenophaga palleronii TaxID=65655 RepID=UPI000825B5D5|nr:response regulator transcription factor [Hydrogenophaga palleronii]
MAKLILLEDEPVLREELTEFFCEAGHDVSAVGTIQDFLRVFVPGLHAIAVIDLGLPDGDGMDLIASLRADGHRLGAIVLTARDATAYKIAGLAGGADHYLPKTVSLEELAATVSALARRLGIQELPRWLLQGSPRQLVPPGFAPIALSGQDHTVLHALATGGACVTREAIVNALGENWFDYDQRRLDTQMRRLRRKVEEACGLSLPISTLRGVGFRFHAPIDVQP